MENESKIRLLSLCKLLYERSDEAHPLSTTQIIEILKNEYSISAHRTTISKDVDVLKEFGRDIGKIESTQNKYFIERRLFETSELKLLIDAVESSKFITDSKSKELVNKLTLMTSSEKAGEIKRNLLAEDRIRPENESIYGIVDAINEAINNGKKISFQYFQYSVNKKKKLKNKGEIYIFSPYSLIWNGDYYYVVGYSDKHENIGSFRIDRIADTPRVLKDDAVPMPAGFDLSEFLKTTFRMFNRKPETVELICDNGVIDSIIDRFGEEVKIYANDMETFRAVVNVAISHVFFSWVFGFGGKVKIKGPDSIKESYANMVKEAYMEYN